MITDEGKDLLLQYYNDTGILKKEIRSYEVSLWTLQDEFITVLKWSDAEHKGRIEKPMMTLNVDGTQSFECSVPMYIWRDGNWLENPSWYARDEFRIINLRKIKVILNKGKPDEEDEDIQEGIFEFLITEVTESHDEQGVLNCNIKCEGLAFNELGKIGYKIALSSDLYDLVQQENEDIKMNIDFWMGEKGVGLEKISEDETPDPTKWYYKVDMNWASFGSTKENEPRAKDVIYEDAFTSSWDSALNPLTTEQYKEKERVVEAENSNIYNITQTIAETFGVYCRYEYGHDINYHITSRTIVFYNNFMQEGNVFSLTYPYSSSSVSRTMDCADLTTKLYVLDVDNDNNLEGYNSIMNAPANPTGEDYILNFDYLYETKGITQEQYDAIKKFEIAVRAKNEEMIPLQNELNKLETQLPEVEGKKTFYENSITADIEQRDNNTALARNLVEQHGDPETGLVILDNSHPDQLFVRIDDDGTQFLNLAYTNKGIAANTIQIYTDYHPLAETAANKLKSDEQITNFQIEYDEYNWPIKIRLLDGGFESSQRLYVIYHYNPSKYYENIAKVWNKKLAEDTKYKEEYTDLYTTLNTQITAKKGVLTAAQDEKKALIAAFERVMGPALREGYWQPEDYKDYGSIFDIEKNFSTAVLSDFSKGKTGLDYKIGWDDQLFEGEQDIYYEQGINREKVYYPCVDLTETFSGSIPSDIADGDYSFVFNTNYLAQDPADPIVYTRAFKINSQALLRYIKVTDTNNNTTTLRPVLVLIGAKTMTDTEIAWMKDNESNEEDEGQPRISKYSTSVGNNGVITVTEVPVTNTISWFDFNNSEAVCVYPRLRFSSLDYIDDYTIIHYNDNLLRNNYDYQQLTRFNDDAEILSLESIITIKPEVLFKYGNNHNLKVHYKISNANTQIYLDALAISKENAYPKVSYDVSPAVVNHSIMRTLYTRLAQLVMINDTDLKFKNIFGYISGMTLDLDHPENDNLEIKNYKTKFEDLFSNIVAQTESMKCMEERLAAAVEGDIPLSLKGLDASLDKTSNINFLENYLNNYFDTSTFVNDKLTSLFTEAGQILSSANSTLNRMTSLTVENAGILSSFAKDIQEELTVHIEESTTRPVSFKVGDIWLVTHTQDGHKIVDARYVAVMNSEDVVQQSADNPTAGYVRTYDGSLASITGAHINMDAVKGEIILSAQNEIKLASGGNVDIAADCNVNIHGNQSVNIGGPVINIGSITESGVTYTGGINLVASAYDTITDANAQSLNAAKVLIHPDSIYMASAAMTLASSSTINILTSGTSTSAISLDAAKGVWIGSDAAVNIFSGPANAENASGASVQLNAEHLILGYANTQSNSATAIELTEDHVIIAAGGNLNYTDWTQQHFYSVGDTVVYNKNHYKCKIEHTSTATWNNSNWELIDITGQSGGLVGAKFTKNSIGFATVTNGVVMNDHGITLGSWTGNNNSAIDLSNPNMTNLKASTGSYVNIAGTGITISSGGELYINTGNFIIDTAATDTDSIFFIGNTQGSYLKYAGNGTLTVNGSVTASSFTATSTAGKFIANGGSFGLYGIDGTSGILTVSGTTLTAASGYTLSIGGDLTINATNFKVNSAATAASNGGQIFFVGDSTGNYLAYNNGALNVKGAITATSLSIGSKTFDNAVKDKIEAYGYTTLSVNDVDNRIIAYVGDSSGQQHSGWTLEPTKMTITSTGTLEVLTSNLVINSAATGDNPIFAVGTNTTKYLSVTSNGLSVLGSVEATSLTVGSGDNLLTYTSGDGLKMKGTASLASGKFGSWYFTSNGYLVKPTDGIYFGTYGICLYSSGVAVGGSEFLPSFNGSSVFTGAVQINSTHGIYLAEGKTLTIDTSAATISGENEPTLTGDDILGLHNLLNSSASVDLSNYSSTSISISSTSSSDNQFTLTSSGRMRLSAGNHSIYISAGTSEIYLTAGGETLTLNAALIRKINAL